MIAIYQGILEAIARRVRELKQQGRSVDEVVATVQEELREAHGTSNRIATTIRTYTARPFVDADDRLLRQSRLERALARMEAAAAGFAHHSHTDAPEAPAIPTDGAETATNRLN